MANTSPPPATVTDRIRRERDAADEMLLRNAIEANDSIATKIRGEGVSLDVSFRVVLLGSSLILRDNVTRQHSSAGLDEAQTQQAVELLAALAKLSNAALQPRLTAATKGKDSHAPART